VPHAIAPREQLQVPMTMWVSPGFARATGITSGCLQAQARAPVQHDHLFHTLLGLLDTRTGLHEPALDLTQACHTAAAPH
jgi:lipid A ethanolaminephosphotransferase